MGHRGQKEVTSVHYSLACHWGLGLSNVVARIDFSIIDEENSWVLSGVAGVLSLESKEAAGQHALYEGGCTLLFQRLHVYFLPALGYF